MSNKLWTPLQPKIEQAELELKRWKTEPTSWCLIKQDITRAGDRCEAYKMCKGDILMGSCNGCAYWQKNQSANVPMPEQIDEKIFNKLSQRSFD